MNSKTAKTKKNLAKIYAQKPGLPDHYDNLDIGTLVYTTQDESFREVGIIVEAYYTEMGDVRRVMWYDGAITTEYATALIRAEELGTEQ